MYIVTSVGRDDEDKESVKEEWRMKKNELKMRDC